MIRIENIASKSVSEVSQEIETALQQLLLGNYKNIIYRSMESQRERRIMVQNYNRTLVGSVLLDGVTEIEIDLGNNLNVATDEKYTGRTATVHFKGINDIEWVFFCVCWQMNFVAYSVFDTKTGYERRNIKCAKSEFMNVA